ncbi:MAG: helix-turn-helix transcriptional regulator [Deltaproteobacteria bacterium]|nr:helix-turn-helix transcriptional regulator [Deltaproteobacteria bacterium]
MQQMMNTKEVSRFLKVNEKMVYSLIGDKQLPATKVTGKWLFPGKLVEQWLENNTLNFPDNHQTLPAHDGLLILAGSNDILLDKVIGLFNRRFSGHLAVFGNVGSMGGVHALKNKHCHIAASHLLQSDDEYNFSFAHRELGSDMPVVVNFCSRRQGILLAKDNPAGIKSMQNLADSGIRIVNRSLGTGTRLLFDMELKKAGVRGEKITGYANEVARHLDVGLEILSGRADAGPGIQAVANLLDLDFMPIRWERFDLLMTKDHFFDQEIQQFLGLLHDEEFQSMATDMPGYEINMVGTMVFPEQHSAGGNE